MRLTNEGVTLKITASQMEQRKEKRIETIKKKNNVTIILYSTIKSEINDLGFNAKINNQYLLKYIFINLTIYPKTLNGKRITLKTSHYSVNSGKPIGQPECQQIKNNSYKNLLKLLNLT